MDDDVLFADRLSTAMALKGVDARWLGIVVGCPKSVIQMYMATIRSPRRDRLVTICRALEVSADWILGLTDGPMRLAHVKRRRSNGLIDLSPPIRLEPLESAQALGLSIEDSVPMTSDE